MIGNTETKEYEFEFVNSEDGSIDFDKVQKLMLRTMNNDMTQRDHLANAALGLCGELGEILNIWGYDDAKLLLELGDVCWYLFLLCDAVGFDVVQVFNTPPFGFLDDADARGSFITNILWLADDAKKVVYHGKSDGSDFLVRLLDRKAIMYTEVCMVYKVVEYISSSMCVTWAAVFQANIDKLAKRHKGGKFSSVLQDAKLDEVEGNE